MDLKTTIAANASSNPSFFLFGFLVRRLTYRRRPERSASQFVRLGPRATHDVEPLAQRPGGLNRVATPGVPLHEFYTATAVTNSSSIVHGCRASPAFIAGVALSDPWTLAKL